MIKKNLITLILITSLFGCRSNNENSDKDASSKSSVALIKSSQALIDEIKPGISGCWMNKEYIDEIKRTKSPQQAYEYVGGITAMLIEPSDIKSDTLSIYCNSGYHEAMKLSIKLDADIYKNAIIIHDKEHHRIKLDKAGQLLTLYDYVEETKSIQKTQFYKVAIPTNKRADQDYFFINQILISGNYIATDSLKNSFEVNFSGEGNVTGLSGFKTYQIACDFMTPPNNLDIITFDPGEKEKSFGFKINADTLNIYGIKDAADSVNQILTNVNYKLVRQK